MAETRIFKPENRLKRIIGSLGDPTVDILAKNAERNIGSLNDAIRAHVAEKLQIIHELAGKPEDTLRAQSKKLGDAALAVCEVAASAGLTAIGETARGIKVMVDAQDIQGVWHMAALNLHIDALTLFSGPLDISEEVRDAVLGNLKAMREKIGILS